MRQHETLQCCLKTCEIVKMCEDISLWEIRATKKHVNLITTENTNGAVYKQGH
jgi:hypothetical protein